MTVDDDQTRRSALLDKISALLAKTQQNGCTEAEAIAAAELAQKLMAKYGLSLSELQAIPSAIEACEADATAIGNRRAHEVLRLASAIAFYTDTRSWYQRHGIIDVGKGRQRLHESHGIVVVYFGLSADVQVAKYLTNTLRTMLDSEWGAFWRAYPKDPKPNARTARASFMRGMTNRLSKRLREMKNLQSKDVANDCREIVLVKEQIVTAAFEDAGIKIGAGRRSSGGAGDSTSYSAGDAAGRRVSISSGALLVN
jgi:uncharacterized protein DUF2786